MEFSEGGDGLPMRHDDNIWERFAYADSYLWGGDPGDQLRTVPAALRRLGGDWRLLHVALIGRGDVARMRHAVTADEFVLAFDFQENSPTEGTWGYCVRGNRFSDRPFYGFACPGEAVQDFLGSQK